MLRGWLDLTSCPCTVKGNSTDRRDDVLKKPEAGRASRLSMIQSEIDGREDDISKAKMMPQALILTVEKEKLDTSVSPSHFSHTSKSSEDFINDSELVPMDRADEHETVAISLSNILPKGPVPAGRKGRKGGRNDLDDLDLNGWVGGNAERGTSKTPYVVAVNDGVV
ncbi:hypothetical protein BC829DRAFT_147017 [Chytridium lagenaria]|nr:hypothetical protein BC829DRAFT_147017 [Chytridium lagenaria]